MTEVHSSSIGEDFTIEEKIEESLKERSRILEDVMKTNEIFMKMILILFTTSVLGKHARSRKKGSCKPLSGEFFFVPCVHSISFYFIGINLLVYSTLMYNHL